MHNCVMLVPSNSSKLSTCYPVALSCPLLPNTAQPFGRGICTLHEVNRYEGNFTGRKEIPFPSCCDLYGIRNIDRFQKCRCAICNTSPSQQVPIGLAYVEFT
jgi:hypothetical protein